MRAREFRRRAMSFLAARGDWVAGVDVTHAVYPGHQTAWYCFRVPYGRIYPLLVEWEHLGWLESRWALEGARPRKFVRLTEAGRERALRWE